MYVYFLKTESGDCYLETSETKYDSAIEFMKKEIIGEYEAWKDEGYEDDEIPYCDFESLDASKEDIITF